MISFSSTVTSLLIELGLLNDSALEGVMGEHIKFYDSFTGEVLYGGLVQSKKKLNKLIKKQHIFYDQSKRLKELLTPYGTKLIEIKTRGESFLIYIPKVLEQLKPLLNNCQKRIDLINGRLKNLKNKLKSRISQKSKYPHNFLFFLGQIKDDKSLPNMIISGDLFLTELEKFIPVDSREQNYSYSSEKIIKKKKYCFIGLNEESKDNTDLVRVSKVSENRFNLYAKNIFLPGFDQMKILEKILEYQVYTCELYKKKGR